VKENIRTVGIDDAAFNRNKSTRTFVFGVVVRGYSLVEGILRTEVQIDGIDATEKISRMIIESKHHEQLRAIFLRSSTIAAFNVINMNLLFERTLVPVITVLSDLPNENNVKKAISNLPQWEKRLNVLNNNPPMISVSFRNKDKRECDSFIQQVGLRNNKEIRELLQLSCFTSCIPESLRLADKIGQSFKNFVLKD
jgi:endonuclease V-like protein UPF0215 family